MLNVSGEIGGCRARGEGGGEGLRQSASFDGETHARESVRKWSARAKHVCVLLLLLLCHNDSLLYTAELHYYHELSY